MASKTVTRSILRVVALTDNLDHLKDCGKITTNTTVSQVNLTSTANNTDTMWPMRPHLMCQKKYNLVSLSQLNTVNITDTVIDLNLNTNHLID